MGTPRFVEGAEGCVIIPGSGTNVAGLIGRSLTRDEVFVGLFDELEGAATDRDPFSEAVLLSCDHGGTHWYFENEVEPDVTASVRGDADPWRDPQFIDLLEKRLWGQLDGGMLLPLRAVKNLPDLAHGLANGTPKHIFAWPFQVHNKKCLLLLSYPESVAESQAQLRANSLVAMFGLRLGVLLRTTVPDSN